MCVLTAPEVFDQADDGKAVVLAADSPTEFDGEARRAGQECPAAAIQLAESS